VRAVVGQFSFSVEPPIRVRDLQRLLAQVGGTRVAINGCTLTADELAELGRQLGSRAVIYDREGRPKGTTLVAPAISESSEAFHGGDGASGEVAPRTAEGGGGEGGEPEGEDLSESVGGEPEPSDQAVRRAAEHRLHRGWEVDNRLLRQVRRLLVRWLDDGVEDYGPRINWAEGMARLLTYRDPRRARIEERGIPRLAVLVDDSPSCGRFVASAAPLAAALMRLGVAETVAVHANGYGAQMWVRGRFVGEVPELTVTAPRLRSATHVLVLGDWDAADLYCELALSRQVIWLDGYRSATVERPYDATDLVRSKWGIRKAAHVRYVAGCCTVEDWAFALAIAI
jgi:hypothetical protein